MASNDTFRSSIMPQATKSKARVIDSKRSSARSIRSLRKQGTAVILELSQLPVMWKNVRHKDEVRLRYCTEAFTNTPRDDTAEDPHPLPAEIRRLLRSDLPLGPPEPSASSEDTGIASARKKVSEVASEGAVTGDDKSIHSARRKPTDKPNEGTGGSENRGAFSARRRPPDRTSEDVGAGEDTSLFSARRKLRDTTADAGANGSPMTSRSTCEKSMTAGAERPYQGIARNANDLVHKCSRRPMTPRGPAPAPSAVSKRTKQTTVPVVRTCAPSLPSNAPVPEVARVAPPPPPPPAPAAPTAPPAAKQSNFRHLKDFSKKIPFDKFPLLSALCESHTRKASEDTMDGSHWFLPLRAFAGEQTAQTADALNSRKAEMEQRVRKRGRQFNSEERLLFSSLWNTEHDVPLEKIIPTLMWIGHAERYHAARKVLASAFHDESPIRLDHIILLLNPGDANDNRTQVELGSVIEHLAKQNGERAVEFCQRQYRQWFEQLDPVKEQVSVLTVSGHFSLAISPEFIRTNTDISRKKLARLIQRLFQLRILLHSPTGLQGSTRSFEASSVMLSLADFGCLLSRCVLAHALDKVRALVKSYGEEGIRVDVKCAAIQREIVVSLLLNKAFWGEKDSENVMSSLLEVHGGATMEDMKNFQKVKAQGMQVICQELEQPYEVGI